VFEAFATQAWYGAAKLALLPIALLCVLPFASAVAFFRVIPFYAAEGAGPSREIARRAAGRHARNWASLLDSVLLTALIFLNVAPVLGILPQLVRMLTGYEGPLSRSGSAVFASPGFWMTAFLLAWILADPLISAHYGLRAFREEARGSGTDLLVTLSRLGRSAAVLLIVAVLPALAAPEQAASAVTAAQLDRGIEEMLRTPEYQWRPDDTGPPQPGVFDSIFEAINPVFETIGRWIRSIFEALFPVPRSGESKAQRASPGAAPRWLTAIALVVVSVGALVLLLRMLRSRRVGPSAEPPAIDPADESVLATHLGSSEWLRAAEEAAARDDYRSAVRASYLGTASALAAAGLLTVAPGRTNGDFVRELRRRGRRASLVEPFVESVRVFERCWYGNHAASADDFADMRSRYEAIASQVSSAREQAA
jgi:hypothetical protein